MDPLTVFVASIVGSMVAEALRTRRELSEYYPRSARGELEQYLGWIRMDGDKVRWLVEEGQAVWIESRYLRPISGNIFDPDKLGAVARGVKRQPVGERIAFYASYGQIHRIGPSDVAESLAYRDYDTGTPWTTGNGALDEWLVRKENREADDPDENERMEEALAAAVAEGQGDLGKWTATTRDGNHRTFGSVLGGETRVAVRFYDNDAQDIQQAARRAMAGEDAQWNDGKMLELLRKAVRDTGKMPHWVDERMADELRLHPGSHEIDVRHPGQRLLFEYHCWEDDESGDAQLWYRSHQTVAVLEVVPFGEGDDEASAADRGGRVYKVRFDDGFEGTVIWEELLDSRKEFERPDPPTGKLLPVGSR